MTVAVKDQLLNLALAAERVGELARLGAFGNLRDPAQLHDAMRRYDRLAFGYLGRETVANFIRCEADRYSDSHILAAMERLAQLAETLAEQPV